MHKKYIKKMNEIIGLSSPGRSGEGSEQQPAAAHQLAARGSEQFWFSGHRASGRMRGPPGQ